ncbi:hypothetical protein B0T14DRAFT_571331 [Immersiella caudata]|uniref:Fungal N-terminal domain-containing protein n=1 Tax=Immersiella caudata TaxID=314043 RepID=A0AA39U5K5_9PEZI|nr:hypothetical protein B0T14DRAFT_571331 [Immersiella caudata]
MELAAAILGVTDIAARTGSKVWSLSHALLDAPDDFHRLGDDITRTQQFFGEVKEGTLCLKNHRLVARFGEESEDQRDFQRLLSDGADLLQRIEGIIDKLIQVNGQGVDGPRELGKRGKIHWIGVVRKEIASLKEGATGGAGRHLSPPHGAKLSETTSTEIQSSIEHSRDDIKQHINRTLAITYTRLDQSIHASGGHTRVHMDSRLRYLESNIITVVKRSLTDELSPIKTWLPKKKEFKSALLAT